MGKAISEVIYDAWCKRMENFLMCYKQDRLIFQAYLQHQEKQYEKRYKCELSLNDDYQEG